MFKWEVQKRVIQSGTAWHIEKLRKLVTEEEIERGSNRDYNSKR